MNTTSEAESRNGVPLTNLDQALEHMPEPRPLSPDLIKEGHAIPVARVQAMHEGKRRARAARGATGA